MARRACGSPGPARTREPAADSAISRRRLARGLAAGGALSVLLPDRVLGQAAEILGREPPQEPALWPFDADGNGSIDAADRACVAAALGARRGTRVAPSEGWDARADVLAAGEIDRRALAALNAVLGTKLPPRPQVICWHYGWYGDRRRRHEPTTVRYLGGSYSSSDRHTEETFNRLKEEFGVGVDMLSWITQPRMQRAWQEGYLSARNRDRRRVGLLYEAAINMKTQGRVEFGPDDTHAERLRTHFRQMAQWIADAARDGITIFRLDGRPVIYLFGSHTWGTTHRDLPHVGRAIARARDAFTTEIGTAPYLIGDESLFPGDDGAGLDRRYRATYFDAITRYHHYDERLIQRLGNGRTVALDSSYVRRLEQLERATISAFEGIDNRFTGAPLLVIPSSAAGFAKRGLPTLSASGRQYAELLQRMRAVGDEHLARTHAARLGTAWLPSPLVVVGSWNEEFEGHALMPSSMNRALPRRERGGFDWLYAIKSIYGWNQWAAGAPTQGRMRT